MFSELVSSEDRATSKEYFVSHSRQPLILVFDIATPNPHRTYVIHVASSTQMTATRIPVSTF